MYLESALMDEIDGGAEDNTVASLCNYVIIDSHDQLLLNVTPCAIKVVTDIYQVALTNLPTYPSGYNIH